MVSHRYLLQTVEAALFAGSQLSPQQRAEVAHLLHVCLPEFKSFLEFLGPKAADRTQVLSKEVRLPNAPPTALDDQDVQIALKLSDDLHLNEVDCVGLLMAAHQEWGLLGREPLEILRLAAGLWFTERRSLIATLQLLLRAVVLDEDLEADFVADIREYLEGLFKNGLRERLTTLIKELNHEEPVDCGVCGAEPYVIDSRGALVGRSHVVQKECLSLCQCLVLSCLVVRTSSHEMKGLYSLLRDCSSGLNTTQEILKLQIAYTLMFVILISLMSDALTGSQEMESLLATDFAFRQNFQQQVMDNGAGELVAGVTSVICLTWAVFMMLTSTSGMSGLVSLSSTSAEHSSIRQCLDRAFGHNVFKFLVNQVLRTPAFQSDDDDMVFMYRAYLHKLLTSFLSQPLGWEKVKELRDLAMISFDSYYYESTYNSMDDDARDQQKIAQSQTQPFISLMELVLAIYEQEPELTFDNDILWNFVHFMSEEHTNYLTLVAFLNMICGLASNEEGARKVYQLLQSKTTRSVGWQTLFNSLNVYDQQFKQSLESTGALLPPFLEGDARALEAYLKVLRKVMENGNKIEKSQWFVDIESLFRLLSYENVPPYLKGALRNAIAAFVYALPVLTDKVWTLLERYDLPLVVGEAPAGESIQRHHAQVYDMSFELNEVEARREEYPSTLSYLILLNSLILNEKDTTDKGRRFAGIFRFVRDQVFASYAQRAYADPVEKWQLVVACLRHFQMMLNLFSLTKEDIRCNEDYLPHLEHGDSIGSASLSRVGQVSEIPTVELMKDLMSGRIVFRNIMSIIMMGVNTILEERVKQLYGVHLEDAVQLSFEIMLLALSKDAVFADLWHPVYQPLDVILGHDNNYIVTLLEYVRYDPSPAIQQCSIKIMTILSARMPQLVSIILEVGVAGSLIEDYAVCLEARSQDVQVPDNPNEDTGFLILQLLLSNLNRPAPNVTHLLLRFDVDQVVERSVLQPKQHYSCLRVLLNVLDSLARPNVNAVLHEFGFQLFYELCLDMTTSTSTVELLRSGKYSFFLKHLDAFACEALPLRNNNQVLRISSLQQRAWLLKLLAVELHASDMDVITHRENCCRLLSRLFTQELQNPNGSNKDHSTFVCGQQPGTPDGGFQKMKVLELLDVLQFQSPETHAEVPEELLLVKENLKVNDILGKPFTVEEGGIYYYSERGDRLIDLAAFRDKLWQEYKRFELQNNLSLNVQRKAKLRDAVQLLLRWGWKYNKNLEEQAAQLHLLVGWSQLVEVAISQRFEFLDHPSQILFEILDASLSAIISPDCSLKMAISLSQVVMTCMAKLQEQSFTSPVAGEHTDDVTFVDLFSSSRLSNSACQMIVSKLVASILRFDSSEVLRRRLYAILLLYFHYSRGMVDPYISVMVMHSLIQEEHDGEAYSVLERLNREQAELARIIFLITKNEASALVDVVAKDATQGNEVGKAIAVYVLDALLGIDQDQVFLSQLQSRGLLHIWLSDICNSSYQVVVLPSVTSIRHLYTLEAELALLLRVGCQNKKRGAQALFAMGALQHLTSCRAIDVQITEDAKWEQVSMAGFSVPSQIDRQRHIVSPILRLVLCLASLVDTSGPLEKVGNEAAIEILEFLKVHQGLISRILRDDASRVQLMELEELQLVTAIMSKVWVLEDSDAVGFRQALFNLACVYFCQTAHSKNRYVLYIKEAEQLPDLASEAHEVVRKLKLLVAQVRYNLIVYLYSLVTKQELRLHVSKPNLMPDTLSREPYTLGSPRLPTLNLVAAVLEQTTSDLDSALEEISLLSAKIQDVNELSRHEVDDIIRAYGRQEYTGSRDNIHKRRYIAMVEMCSAAGTLDCEVSFLYFIVEHALNILYIHFEDKLQLSEKLMQEVEGVENIAACFGTKDELRSLTEKLLPTLQHLEQITEERADGNKKHLQRLVRSLKSQVMLRFM